VVAGVDEAGRGCWAGPVVAAAVVLPRVSAGLVRTLRGLRDSKQLSPRRREFFARLVAETARGTGLGIVSAAAIDLLGLGAAGRLALERAVRALPMQPDYLLIDGFRLPSIDVPQEGVVFGDALCLSVAAASVVAKYKRDLMLDELASRHPGYGFERNRGYGTSEHVTALRCQGPTPEHRLSYLPLRRMLETANAC
jgi:ribonuclease HII